MQDSQNDGLGEILEVRLGRRRLLKSLCAIAAVQVLGGRALLGQSTLFQTEGGGRSTLSFPEVKRGRDETLHVAKGYSPKVLMRWGDPLVTGAPDFDPYRQSAAAQNLQFGYNCDFIGLTPLPHGAYAPKRLLMGVNHEYTTPDDMFPEITDKASLASFYTKEHAKIEMAAVGFSVVELVKSKAGDWDVVRPSPLNRRFSLLDSPMAIEGPARGHARMKTNADPKGMCIQGTTANCAGGLTPWGTFLTCEENFDYLFRGTASDAREAASQKRMKMTKKGNEFYRFDDRFDISKEEREPNRYGWVVEIDPHDPNSTPVKRTALGRFKHEGATVHVNPDGRVVVYTGDDERGEFFYRFVSKDRFNKDDRSANKNLLNEGVLSVAHFDASGTLTWLPLVHNEGPLTTANGFHDQGDVVIDARRAADLVGATKMDRPEDVEVNPVTGTVYLMLTNNVDRGVKYASDAANPRAVNVHGHVIEIEAPTSKGHPDHTADAMKWTIFIRGGDPKDATSGADYQGSLVSDNGWLSCPDNCTFDGEGRLWISTDGAKHTADGIYACDTLGPGRALTRLFLRGPKGCEICGPNFGPGDRTFFASIQHPGESKDHHFGNPMTRWPDFKKGMPPRPSVVVVRKDDGGRIGK